MRHPVTLLTETSVEAAALFLRRIYEVEAFGLRSPRYGAGCHHAGDGTGPPQHRWCSAIRTFEFCYGRTSPNVFLTGQIGEKRRSRTP